LWRGLRIHAIGAALARNVAEEERQDAAPISDDIHFVTGITAVKPPLHK